MGNPQQFLFCLALSLILLRHTILSSKFLQDRVQVGCFEKTTQFWVIEQTAPFEEATELCDLLGASLVYFENEEEFNFACLWLEQLFLPNEFSFWVCKISSVLQPD